ncbi:hypothetical protein ACHQM5_028261 [Ranunculus cassubicifolius]
MEASRPATPTPAAGSMWKSYGNPCIDTFYYLPSDISWQKDLSASRDFHMKRLLPHAWSYSPVTTLKIIRDWGIMDLPPMCDAIYWLHHNHPKTLVANLMPLLTNYPGCSYLILISILCRILGWKEVETSMEMIAHVEETNKVRDLYERDSDFRSLHDEIARLFAESLKFDIQNCLKKEHDYDCDKDQPLELTDAADFCEASPFLVESVAKRVFPHVREVEAAVELLRNEVLDPLKKVLCIRMGDDYTAPENCYGYINQGPGLRRDPCRKERLPAVHKYLKDLEQSLDKMVADAILPNELVECVIDRNSGDVSRHVVELQWKAMVEDLKKKKKRQLSSSLAVIQTYNISSPPNLNFSELTYAMTILISELSEEEAWKGKVISLTPDPQLLSIQGHDLKSKCEFLCDPAKMLTHTRREYIDCKKVFDLILQQAVSTSLKPEQMIRKVFVFSSFEDFERISSGSGGRWEAQDYDEMRSKYREHGYDIPEIVFWRPNAHMDMPFTDSPDERGIAAISGFYRAWWQHTWAKTHFVKMFLENDGHVSPQHLMDAILSDKEYNYAHRFTVLD